MFVSHHTLKWTRTCRSHGRHPHAHTAHFLLNRHKRIRDKVSVFVRQRPSAAIPEMTQLRLTGRVLLSPYAVDDLGFTIVADGVESASAGTNTGRHSNE